MARIRSIHPGLWTDEAFVTLSPFARLLFIGLWNECDDKGCFQWSPIKMKMRILPVDNIDVSLLMEELATAGRIRRYEIGGRKYGAVRNFTQFQNPRSPNDIHPAGPEIRNFVGLEQPIDEITDDEGDAFPQNAEKPPQRERRGEERSRRGKGGESIPRARKARCPDNFAPHPSEGSKTALRMAKWPPDHLLTQIEKFIAHHQVKGNLYSDWQKAWTTWVLNDFDAERMGNGNGTSTRTGNGLLDACAEDARNRH